MKFLYALLLALLLGSCVPTGGEEDPIVLNNSTSEALADFLSLDDIDPAPYPRSLTAADADWYKDAVFYHLWIPAFADGPDLGDEGDIPGIIANLGYLQNDLGITAIWLSPFMDSGSSASNRHNYDVKDHELVNPAFGNNQDLLDLIDALHAQGMRVILDHVPNHVSDQHPWFGNSKSSSDGKRDWFLWVSEQPAGFKGWDSFSDFHGPLSGDYYYGLFSNRMPDLNYRNQGVRDAMGNTVIHWLNAGFDGIRVDAVKYLYENWDDGSNGYKEHPLTFRHFNQIRTQILEPYAEPELGAYPKFMVAENWDSNRDNLLKYMKNGDDQLFHMTLDFPFAYAAANLNWDGLDSHWNWVKSTVEPAGGWMGSFLSNHDNVVDRPFTKHGGDAGKTRIVAALNLLGVGTPFIYYGNEIGMTGAAGNDIDLRQPLDWDAVDTQKADATSLLNWHKKLITLRKGSPALKRGTYTKLTSSDELSVFAFERKMGGETLVVVINKTGTALGAFTVTPANSFTNVNTLLGTAGAAQDADLISVPAGLVPYGVRVLKLDEAESGGSLMDDVAYTPPAPADVYLRGAFTNWNPGTQMSHSDGVYTLTLALTAGEKQFKFYNSGWVGHGSLTYSTSIGGDAVATTGSVPDDNITFTAVAGSYTFRYKPSTSQFSIDAP